MDHAKVSRLSALLAPALVGWLVVGCSAAAKDSSGNDSGDGTSSGPGGSSGGAAAAAGTKGSNGSGAAGTSGGANGAPVPELPPEREEVREFEAPRAGARFVYVVNTKRDTVAVIDSTNLVIRTVNVGDGPLGVVTPPGKDVALVLNAGSSDVSILRSGPEGTKVTTVPSIPGANTISVAPDGAHAIVWNDRRVGGATAAPVGSSQDIALIALSDAGDTAVPLTVGFRPTQVTFSSDGASGFVITEDGISLVPFAAVTEPRLLPLVPLPTRAKAETRDVIVTADGKLALTRVDGSPTLDVIDLVGAAHTRVALDLGSPVSDLDLAADGSFALATLREARSVVRIALPAGLADAAGRITATFPDEIVGSAVITPDGRKALLYTTVVAQPRVLVVDMATPTSYVPVPLHKGIRAVAVSPDSRRALVIHNKAPGSPTDSGIDEDERNARSYGYTLLDFETGFAKLQLTPDDPGPLAIASDSSVAFVLFRNDKTGVRLVQRIVLGSFFVADVVLGSPPVSIGALPASRRMFVNQVHPEGRLSFIDWDSGSVASVTGFELNGRIVE